MRAAIRAVLRWIAGIWSEPNGQGSSSRVHAAIAFISAVGLAWYATVRQVQIPEGAMYLTLFVLGGGVGAYGANKFTVARMPPAKAASTPEADG